MLRLFDLTLPLLVLSAAPNAQTWEEGPAFPDATQGREFAAGLVVSGQTLAIGGSPFDDSGDDNAPVHGLVGGVWLEHAPVEGPIVRSGAGVDALGRIVVFGGVDGIDPEGDKGKSFVYDLVEGKQGSTAQRSALAPDDLFAWASDDAQRLYSIGGGPGAAATPGDPNSTRVERYDALVDAWTVLAPTPWGVADAAAVNDGLGRILVLGGFAESGGARTAEVLAYDVATDGWSSTAVPDLPAARSGLRAVLGADGRVHAMGGSDAGGARVETYVLDLVTNTWSAGPDLVHARERFGAVLGADDHVHVLGGSDGAGGTPTTERLYTPPCPVFPTAPEARTAWVGGTVTLSVPHEGGTPLDYRWLKDGVELFDGAAAGGGTLSGADALELTIVGLGLADAGDYSVRVSNPCGIATSSPLVLTVGAPPALGTLWTRTVLHPGDSLGSQANAVSGTDVGGSATYPDPTYGALEQAFLWSTAGGPGVALTPPSSVGASISAIKDGVQIGWWWWPYTTPLGTGYHRHAALWTGSVASHVDLQPSGWEYGSAADTDGSDHVGTLTFDDSSTTSDGVLWHGTSPAATYLTPSVAWGSSAAAVDGGHQYGSVNLGFGVVHAARWAGSAATYEDLNPPGSSWSYVNAADSGQEVGRATFGGAHHAVLWTGAAETYLDLNPPGATSSDAKACKDGLQLGTAVIGGASVQGLWSGTADSFVDLSPFLGSGYAWYSILDLDVGPDGTVTLVGYGYDDVQGRAEAMMWRAQTEALSADPLSVSLSTGGTQGLHLASGVGFAGDLYLLAGSGSGTSPGIPLGGVVLPLNPDPYFNLTLREASSATFENTLGFLSGAGAATAAIHVPTGLDPGFAGLTFHHAYGVLDTTGGAVVFTSNATELSFEP